MTHRSTSEAVMRIPVTNSAVLSAATELSSILVALVTGFCSVDVMSSSFAVELSSGSSVDVISLFPVHIISGEISTIR